MSTKLFDGFQNPGAGITVCIPTLGRPVNIDWALSLKSLTPPINFNMIQQVLHGLPVAEARNKTIEAALERGHRYIFFLGDDVVVPPDTLKKLIYKMENNKNIGVIGGVYCSKSEPAAPLVFRGNGTGSYWDWRIGEFFEVTGLGMDCTIIRTEMCVDMMKKDPELFKTVDEDQFADGINNASMWTEDLYFLDRVTKETDYKIFCDGSIICDHWEYNQNKYFNLPADSYPLTGIKHEGDKLKAIDLGCGNTRRIIEGYNILRYDISDDGNPDYRGDVRSTPFANSEFDLIFSSHVLEHLPREDTEKVLEEWSRILKDQGIAVIVVPDLEWAAQNVVNGNVNRDTLNVFYGAQSSQYDFHYNGFTRSELENCFHIMGFTEVRVFKVPPYNLVGIATSDESVNLLDIFAKVLNKPLEEVRKQVEG